MSVSPVGVADPHHRFCFSAGYKSHDVSIAMACFEQPAPYYIPRGFPLGWRGPIHHKWTWFFLLIIVWHFPRSYIFLLILKKTQLQSCSYSWDHFYSPATVVGRHISRMNDGFLVLLWQTSATRWSNVPWRLWEDPGTKDQGLKSIKKGARPQVY